MLCRFQTSSMYRRTMALFACADTRYLLPGGRRHSQRLSRTYPENAKGARPGSPAKLDSSSRPFLSHRALVSVAKFQEIDIPEARFPGMNLLETVWKIAGGLIERGFWQYKR